jgi:hypothetical protein
MKRKITLFGHFVVILSLLLFINSFTCNAQIRGIRLPGVSISETSSENDALIAKLTTNDVGDVFIWVQLDGTQTSAAKLSDFVPKAKTAGIKVHFVITVFKDNAYTTNNPGSIVWKCPEMKPGVTYPHPRLMPVDTRFANFHDPGYAKHIRSDIADFIQTYGPDGICLDKMNYSHFVYSFDPLSAQKAYDAGCDTTNFYGYFNTIDNYSTYASNNGIINLYTTGAGGDPDVVKWFDMRKDVIAEFIQAVRDTIDVYNENIKLSALFRPTLATSDQSQKWQVMEGMDYAYHSPYLDYTIPAMQPDYYDTGSAGGITGSVVALHSGSGHVVTQIHVTGNDSLLEAKFNSTLPAGSHGIIVYNYPDISTAEWNVIKTQFGKLKVVSDNKEINADLGFNIGKIAPNPVKTSTLISYNLSKPCYVTLNVYDALGREVKTLVKQNMSAGAHIVNFDASDLSSGVYFCRLEANGTSSVKKMIINK